MIWFTSLVHLILLVESLCVFIATELHLLYLLDLAAVHLCLESLLPVLHPLALCQVPRDCLLDLADLDYLGFGLGLRGAPLDG